MQPGSVMNQYRDEVFGIINNIHANEKEHVLDVARIVAEQVKKDKLIYVFGPGGHSNLGAMEIFFRAGGLMHISALLNQETMLSAGALKSMQVERLPGYGRILVNDYGIGKDELLIIVNAYGINSATIDAALQARENGATVVGISSYEHAKQCSPEHIARHPSKQNLHEIVDYAIDCKISTGDAVISIPGFEQKIGALSTFANAYILNSIVVEAISMIVDEGVDPPVWKSGNAPGGDEWNTPRMQNFIGRVKCL